MAGPKIRQRGKHWFTVPVSLGTDPLTRKRRRIWLSGKTRAEVQSEYIDLQAQLQRGTWCPPAKEPFGTYLQSWVDAAHGRLAESTIYGYRNVVRQVQAAPLGSIPLRELTPEHLEAYYAIKRKSGLSPNGVRAHHRVIRAALGRARKRRKIADNPAALVDLPAAILFEPQIFDTEKLKLFLGEAKRTSRFYPLYLTAATTGLRLSELLGARWQDLHRDGTFLVRQAFVRVPKAPLERNFKGPKSPKSRRPVYVEDFVMGVLRNVHAEQQRQKGMLGAAYHDRDLIFCQLNGKPHHAQNITRRDLKPLLKRAGLSESFRFHDQRHSHLSHLERLQTPMSVMQERAGHSNPAITLGIYTHALADQQREAARAVAADLGLQGD